MDKLIQDHRKRFGNFEVIALLRHGLFARPDDTPAT